MMLVCACLGESGGCMGPGVRGTTRVESSKA